MLVCVFLCTVAHETAGAACTRCSLRPLIGEGGNLTATSGEMRREIAKSCTAVSPPSTRLCPWRGGVGGGGLSACSSGREFAEAPPPPTPKSELRSSRPHRFAGGGEELMAMAGCLKIESLRRGACHRARVRATRWLPAMTAG